MLVAWLAWREIWALPARVAIVRIRRRHFPKVKPQIRELTKLRDGSRRNRPARCTYSERIRELSRQVGGPERRRPVVLTLAKLAGILALCAFTLSLAGLFGNTRPPRFSVKTTPRDLEMDYRAISYTTEDGVDIAAWHIPGMDGAPVIVLLHGLGTAKVDMLGAASALRSRGFHCLLPDFRAHGESGGTCTSFGYLEMQDLRAALRAARELPGADSSRIGVYGFSMGAAVALMGAADEPDVLAVTAEAPYDTLARATGHYGSILYKLPPRIVTALMWPAYAVMFQTRLGDVAPVQCVGAIQAKVMIVGSEDDPLVAPGTLSALRAAAPEAAIYAGPGTGHVTDEIDPGYFERVVEFFEEALMEDAAE